MRRNALPEVRAVPSARNGTWGGTIARCPGWQSDVIMRGAVHVMGNLSRERAMGVFVERRARPPVATVPALKRLATVALFSVSKIIMRAFLVIIVETR